jgi:hypothetical protein
VDDPHRVRSQTSLSTLSQKTPHPSRLRDRNRTEPRLGPDMHPHSVGIVRPRGRPKPGPRHSHQPVIGARAHSPRIPPPMGSPPPSWTAEPSTSGWPRHAFARTAVDELARRPGEGHMRQPTSAHLGEDRQSPLRSHGRSRKVPGVGELTHMGPDRTDRHPASATNLDAGKHAGAHQVIDPGMAHPSDSATCSGLNSNRSMIICFLPGWASAASPPITTTHPTMKPHRPRFPRRAGTAVDNPRSGVSCLPRSRWRYIGQVHRKDRSPDESRSMTSGGTWVRRARSPSPLAANPPTRIRRHSRASTR